MLINIHYLRLSLSSLGTEMALKTSILCLVNHFCVDLARCLLLLSSCFVFSGKGLPVF